MPARSITETYTYLRQIAPDFAQQISTATASAHNEAEFESKMNAAIAVVAHELGVELAFRQEYTLRPAARTRSTIALSSSTKTPARSAHS